MDTTPIYILDSRLQSPELEEAYANVTPYTEDQLADMVIQKAHEIEDNLYEKFLEDYDDVEFTRIKKTKQLNMLIAHYKKLKEQKFKPVWNNNLNIKTSVIDGFALIPVYEKGKRVLWYNRIENIVHNTALDMILHRKKEYYVSMIDKIAQSIQDDVKTKQLANLAAGESGSVNIVENKQKEEIIDMASILRSSFPDYVNLLQIDNLLCVLEKGCRYSIMKNGVKTEVAVDPIIFTGKKEDLWKSIGKIRSKKNIHLNNLKKAISEHIVWREHAGAMPKRINVSDVKSNYAKYKDQDNSG